MPRRLQSYDTPEIVVTFDPNRCIHAAECVRGLPDVFDPKAKRWIRPERASAEAIAAVVARCPTGALHATNVRTGGPFIDDLAGDGLTVRATRHGPLYLRGPVRLRREDGSELLVDGRVALCRCGRTGNDPFCDGSHARVGFRAPAEAGAEPVAPTAPPLVDPPDAPPRPRP